MKNVAIPSSSNRSDLPTTYLDLLAHLKERIQNERIKSVLSANAGMVLLYWEIGKQILQSQKLSGWGSKVIARLSNDLSKTFPDMKGFSPRNLLFMRAFVETYPEISIVKQVVSLIPWGHIVRLIQTVKDPGVREWYIRSTVTHGWSRSVLEMQINRQLHRREGKATHNFKDVLPPAESDLASQFLKDPYLFDFIGTADPRREAEVEQALVNHVQKFLLEMGTGFAFVGRQVHLEVGDEDFYIDLLFYHLRLRCYVVVELKAVAFKPEFIGKLNFYLSAVDDLIKHAEDKPTIGLLLVHQKNHIAVEYALRDMKKPMGVSQWETKLVEELPKELKGSLPSVEEIEKEFSR